MKFKLEAVRLNLKKTKFYISEYKDKEGLLFRNELPALLKLAKFHVKMAEEYLNV